MTRRPNASTIPDYLRRTLDVLADETRTGPIVVVVKNRGTRRFYCREIAKRGGIVPNLHFGIAPDMPDDAASQLRQRVGPRVRILDVREMGARPQCGRG
jgi:exonuclease V gamma subunit